MNAKGKPRYGVRRRGNSLEFKIVRSGYRTFTRTVPLSEEAEARVFFERLADYLDVGIAPEGFVRTDVKPGKTLADLIAKYLAENIATADDRQLLGVAVARKGSATLMAIDVQWADAWIADMKRVHHLAPGTIRHHVGALKRCFSWAKRQGQMIDNPLRDLPTNYSLYTPADQEHVEPRTDTSRERRLQPGEYRRMLKILRGWKRADRERPLMPPHRDAIECIFKVALQSCMRMREMYSLTVDQVDLENGVIYLERTKNGDKRQVPLTTPARKYLRKYMAKVGIDATPQSRKNLKAAQKTWLFPWLPERNIAPAQLEAKTLSPETARAQNAVTALLSQQFGRVFAAADAEDFTFHDTRHEAISRLFELTDLSEIEIQKITGHLSKAALMRYTNLRASRLAKRLW